MDGGNLTSSRPRFPLVPAALLRFHKLPWDPSNKLFPPLPFFSWASLSQLSAIYNQKIFFLILLQKERYFHGHPPGIKEWERPVAQTTAPTPRGCRGGWWWYVHSTWSPCRWAKSSSRNRANRGRHLYLSGSALPEPTISGRNRMSQEEYIGAA